MKSHNIVIITFCLLAGTVLLATTYTRSQLAGQALESEWRSTIEDLCDNSSSAYIQSQRYNSYAAQAAREDDAASEQLFRALAYSEIIHERMCAKAAQLFGGEYTTPTDDTDLSTTTDENLKRCIASARTRHDLTQGGAATRAIESGNRYVARILIWIDGSNRRHIELLERAENAESGQSIDVGYLVCPKCGNVYHTASYDTYCPFCQTHYSDFKKF